MGADEAKASDTTKILPARMNHIWVDLGPNLVCRACGARMPLPVPALADRTFREIRGFIARHARCSK